MSNLSAKSFQSRMQAVCKPVAEALALPNESYTSEEKFAFERDHVVGKSWASIGYSSELPEPGFAKPVEFMGLPVLLVRDKQNQVRVFHNVCSHRGMCLVEKQSSIRSTIRCPYHSWAYSCEGELVSTPHIGGVDVHTLADFDKSTHSLKPIDFAIWMDIIFINLSGDAEPFAEFIAPLEARWAKFWGAAKDSGFCPAENRMPQEIDVHCNWKLPVENYCEAYHLPTVHPALNSYSPLEQHYPITDGDNMSGQGSSQYTLASAAGTHLPLVASWPKEKRNQSEYISLYPNTLLGLQVDHFVAVVVAPQKPDLCTEKVQLSYIRDQDKSTNHEEFQESVFQSWMLIFNEDVFAVEGMQKGRQSPGFDGGALTSSHDVPTHHFHSWVANKYLEAMT